MKKPLLGMSPFSLNGDFAEADVGGVIVDDCELVVPVGGIVVGFGFDRDVVIADLDV
jgi:hypothetical protein